LRRGQIFFQETIFTREVRDAINSLLLAAGQGGCVIQVGKAICLPNETLLIRKYTVWSVNIDISFLMVSGTNSGFGRNQIYLKLKFETWEFMPGIKNMNMKFFCIFF
jgi:hypothetical protein